MPMKPSDESSQDSGNQRPAPKREWVRPQLVEYGHLAKLTRGGSGLFTETGGMMANII